MGTCKWYERFFTQQNAGDSDWSVSSKLAGDSPARRYISSVIVRSHISFFVEVSFIAVRIPYIGRGFVEDD